MIIVLRVYLAVHISNKVEISAYFFGWRGACLILKTADPEIEHEFKERQVCCGC